VPGLASFVKKYPTAKPYLVGTGGIPLDEFLRLDPLEMF